MPMHICKCFVNTSMQIYIDSVSDPNHALGTCDMTLLFIWRAVKYE